MRWLLVSIAILGASVLARPAREALCSYGTSNYSLSWEYGECISLSYFKNDSQILAVLKPGRAINSRLQRDHHSDELSNDVVFRLTATSAAKNFWTGVYFGEEEPVSSFRSPASTQFPATNNPALIIQFDAIGLFVRNGQIGLVDAHLPAGEEATVSCTTFSGFA